MTGLEPVSSGVGSDHSANHATTSRLMVGSHDGQRIQIHYIMGGNRLFFKWAKPDLYFG